MKLLERYRRNTAKSFRMYKVDAKILLQIFHEENRVIGMMGYTRSSWMHKMHSQPYNFYCSRRKFNLK